MCESTEKHISPVALCQSPRAVLSRGSLHLLCLDQWKLFLPIFDLTGGGLRLRLWLSGAAQIDTGKSQTVGGNYSFQFPSSRGMDRGDLHRWKRCLGGRSFKFLGSRIRSSHVPNGRNEQSRRKSSRRPQPRCAPSWLCFSYWGSSGQQWRFFSGQILVPGIIWPSTGKRHDSKSSYRCRNKSCATAGSLGATSRAKQQCGRVS
mmetsp:Transcript_14544/g.32931  ORF Transcript_14544/g.32931 Transcript_14544/m.32931 type:complete len:204 (-) Transcript_14544:249-860(-)